MFRQTDIHDIPFPFVVDKEDFQYIQKAAEIISQETDLIHSMNNVPPVGPLPPSHAVESEKLFRDIINNGIDDEDILYLKSCFDSLKNLKRYCLACNVLNWIPPKSVEIINRQTTLEGAQRKPVLSNFIPTRLTKREETITRPTESEGPSESPTTPDVSILKTNGSDHTIPKPKNPKPYDSEHVITEPNLSNNTENRKSKLDDIIDALSDPEEYFAKFKHIFNQESCWFHRLSWTSHPTTSKTPESNTKCTTPDPTPREAPQTKIGHKTKKTGSSRKGRCARTQGYSKDDITVIKDKMMKPKEINEIGYFSSKQKIIAKNKEMLKNQLLAKLAEKNKTKKLKENSLSLPYSKTYKGRKLKMSKDMWNEQRRLTSASKFNGSNLFNINHLKFLNSKLMLGKSQIHGSGVFAVEPIHMHDIIIEYVGEVIRPIIADLREKKYKQSFCFSIDDQTVVDATNFGNISRFINHSCKPNSYAKLLVYNNQKKIVIYAKRNISAGEEITYDYKMKTEGDDKIECLCKAPGCKKTLN